MHLVKLNVNVIKLNDLSKLNLFRNTYRCLKKNLLLPPQKRLSSVISNVTQNGLYELEL